jgi:hypothetical protein
MSSVDIRFLWFYGNWAVRIWAPEFGHCPKSIVIWRVVEITMEFGQRCRVSKVVEILAELRQYKLLLDIFMSKFRQNLDNTHNN